MLKSIFKKNIIYENNVNRKTIGKHTKIQFIILCLVITIFLAIFNFYNNNKLLWILNKLISKIVLYPLSLIILRTSSFWRLLFPVI